MTTSLEVLFSPAEFLALRERDLSQTVSVVFDILRATSSMMTALANGAERILPVGEIDEALALRPTTPNVLLAGERDGVRIRAQQTGSVDFDLGNSPREFTPPMVRGKTVIMSTTNGTRALRACASSSAVYIGSFLGLTVLAKRLRQDCPANLLLIGAGTIDQAAYEDTLAAGALADLLWPGYEGGLIADSASMARTLYRQAAPDLLRAMQFARNGRRLLANPELREDVPFCVQRDTLQLIAAMNQQGEVRKIES